MGQSNFSLLDPWEGEMPGRTAGQVDDAPVRMSLALGRVEGDKDLLKELVDTFLEDLSERVAFLTAAIRRGDGQETFRSAHSLRGPLGILCAEKALALAGELETMGRAGQLGEAATVCDAFELEITRAAAFLSSFDWKSL
jgi:HPt (histidine-containing phosphotransfer) domain-containing protein